MSDRSLPAWYEPGSVLGSAVKHLAAISPRFDWVGIYVLNGETLELACSGETASELVVLIRDREGRILGQIDIDSHTRAAFGPGEEAAVRKVAKELGELWPT